MNSKKISAIKRVQYLKISLGVYIYEYNSQHFKFNFEQLFNS